MRINLVFLTVGYLLLTALAAGPDLARGQRLFGACGPCHALQPNRNMTGPSLAQLFGTARPEALTAFRVTPGPCAPPK